MYIKRDLEDQIRVYLKKPEILAIIGPRQSGKTTLLKEIAKPLKKAVYLNFEDRDILNLFNNDIKSFYNRYAQDSGYLLIDEFQYAKNGGQKLKYLFDTHWIKIIISGSSSLDLTHQAVKYLVGRIFIFYLFPLNFKEFLSYRRPDLYKNIYINGAKKINDFWENKRNSAPVFTKEVTGEFQKYYHEFTIFGGYPRVILAKNKNEKIMVLKNIYNTYFLREIRDILQLSTEEELQKLIKALALQIGSVMKYNELSQITSLNYESLLKHLNILEKTFVIKRVLPFCRNKRIEIAKVPKVFFWDNGFRNRAINNFQDFEFRTDRGSLNENFIAGQLLKKELAINYWRSKSKAEIDFVLERESGLTALEVKSTLRSNTAGRALLSFKEKYAPAKLLVASESYSAFDQPRNILFMPLFFI
ncbi:MAG: ATP-binding protein [Planctomycetota bacterium]